MSYSISELKSKNETLFKVQKRLSRWHKVEIVFDYGKYNSGLASYDYRDHTISFYTTNFIDEYERVEKFGEESNFYVSYEEFGLFTLFHEIGHSLDPNRKGYEAKQKHAKDNRNYELFANLEIYAEYMAFILGKDVLIDFMNRDYYKNTLNDPQIDLSVSKHFYDTYNLKNLHVVTKKLGEKYPKLINSNWYNKVLQIVETEKLQTIKDKLPKLVKYNKRSFG